MTGHDHRLRLIREALASLRGHAEDPAPRDGWRYVNAAVARPDGWGEQRWASVLQHLTRAGFYAPGIVNMVGDYRH
jgi:hypothetical protein